MELEQRLDKLEALMNTNSNKTDNKLDEIVKGLADLRGRMIRIETYDTKTIAAKVDSQDKRLTALETTGKWMTIFWSTVSAAITALFVKYFTT